MKHGKTKTLRVGCILLVVLFLFGAFALLPQSVRAQAVTATVTGLSVPAGVAVTPNGAYVYVISAGSNSVSVINTASNTVTATVPVGSVPAGVAVTPNGAYVYVTNSGDNTVSVISTASNTVTATITVGSGPQDVAVTPNGNYVYVTNLGSGSVSVISTATNTVTATVTVGTYPWGVAVTPDGAYAYVANALSGSVSVISTATNTVTATVPVGIAPFGVAVSPDGAYVYVANIGSDTVSVISTGAQAVPVIINTCDGTGTLTSSFNAGDTVYATGTGFAASATYNIYVVPTGTLTNGVAFPTSVSSISTITTDSSGNIPSTTPIYIGAAPGTYVLVVDLNNNGIYDQSTDPVCNVQTTGNLFVAPEYLYGGLIALAICFGAFALFSKRKNLPVFSIKKKTG
jgi:YVTN family beta-propeller protein